MTGPLTVAGSLHRADATYLSAGQQSDANAVTRKDYVDTTFVNVTGDTMTGPLFVARRRPVRRGSSAHQSPAW